MTDHIKIREAEGTWSVRAGGAVLAESTNALELAEGSIPEVIYFPREDIAMAFLDRTEKVTTCPWKGEATYYSIVTNDTTIPNAAWSYEAPKDGVSKIANHLAFYTGDHVAVEKL